jgi:hypothetical protein
MAGKESRRRRKVRNSGLTLALRNVSVTENHRLKGGGFLSV